VEPEEEDADDPAAIVLLRMGMVRRMLATIDTWLIEFAQLRISPEWERRVVPAMREWIEEKASGKC
jgi:hypothetical protein